MLIFIKKTMTLLTIFWSKRFYHNTIEEWFISLGIILGGIIVAKIFYWFIGKYVKRITQKTKTRFDDILVDALEEPVLFTIGLIASWYAIGLLHFTWRADEVIADIFHLLLVINVTWFLARILDAFIIEYLVPIVEKSESELDDQIMPILRKGVRYMIWILGIIVALNNVGYDVGALIAGLGIGGLALALAAQDTVKNIFGGIMIFVDKPFKLGDRITLEGFDGTIEEIGLRMTRMRKLDGRLVTIPNSKFSENSIENISLEPSRKVTLKLGLTYDTSPDKMKEAIAILHQILEDHEHLVTKDTWTLFDSYGDFSLGINYVYFIKKEADIPKTQTIMHLAILERFNAAELEFAFPTQTIFKKEL